MDLWLDDTLWLRSIYSWQRLRNEDRGAANHDERDLWHLLKLGLVDPATNDRPYDGAVRSMRHTSVVGDHLWSLIALERQRVGSSVVS